MNHKKLLKFFAAAVVLCLALTGQAFAADASQNIATRAAGVSVRGRVTSYLPGVSCTVQLRQGDAVRYSTASFPGSGAGLGTQEFIIPGVADGVYDLVITKPGHLNYTIRNIVVQGSDVDLTTNDNDLVSDITLVAGDINGDGCVDLQDLIALTSSDNFGKSPVVTVFDNGAADNPEDLTGLDDFYYETTEDGITITGVKDKTKTAYVVPDIVTSIGDSAFRDCTSLTSITIPDSVISIGDSAFSGCSSLTSITIPNSVTSIGKGMFFRCSSLTSVVIPDSVISIGNSAFDACTSLERITIPGSVTSIGYYAFNTCTSLTSVTIPDSITSMGYHAFYGCKNLTSVTYGGTKAQWDAITEGTYWDKQTGSYTITYEGESPGLDDFLYETTENGITITGVKDNTKTEYIVPKSVTSIAGGAFQGCTNLESITLPFIGETKDGTKNTHFGYIFGASAYANNKSYVPTSLKTVVMTGVTSIGEYAFYSCTSLTSVNFPACTSISDAAFSYCSSLTSITIPGSVTSIGDYAFYGCSSLTSITIPNSVTSIGNYAFAGCTSLSNVYITDVETWCEIWFADGASNPLCNDGNLYLNGVPVTNLVIPDGVTSIGNYAFYGYTGLTSMTIPDSVTSIGVFAFSACRSLTSVTIGNNVTSIGEWAFSACRSLTSVVIPDSVTSIGDGAFAGCSSLTSVTIPDNVTSIGQEAFRGCTSLTSITIPNSVTYIGYSAFYGCSSLTSVTIPDSVTFIGYGAFYSCSGLTSVTIPGSVKSIEYETFRWCTSLTSITIPDSVTIIDARAFFGCGGLTSITIPDSVTDIGEEALSYCSSLTSIKFRGTKSQWEAITKGTDWDLGTGAFTVTYNYTGE